MTATLTIVGRWTGETWEFQGVFDSEAKAIDACRDASYFVGPVTLNEIQPHESVPWPGAYYPLEEKDGSNLDHPA